MNDKFYRSYLNIIKESEDNEEETLDPTPDQFMVDDDEHDGYYNIHFCIPESFIYDAFSKDADLDEFNDSFSKKYNVKAYDNSNDMIYCEVVIPKEVLKEFLSFKDQYFIKLSIISLFTRKSYDADAISEFSNDEILEILENFKKGDAWSIDEVDSADAYDYSYDEQPLAFVVSEMVEDYFS